MKYRSPRSPPKNYKVNFIEEPPLETPQRTYLMNLVPRIGRSCVSAEDNQYELSQELSKYLKKSVSVSVVEKPNNYDPDHPERHLRPITFRMTMNEFLYRVWIIEDEVEFEENPFAKQEQ